MKKLFCVIAALLFAHTATAERLSRTCIDSDTRDPVGGVLEYRLRNELRKNAVFQLVERCEDANFMLTLKTLDPDDPPKDGNQTVYSLVFSVRLDKDDLFTYGSSTVGICGGKRTEECASRMVTFADRNYNILKKAAEDYIATPRK